MATDVLENEFIPKSVILDPEYENVRRIQTRMRNEKRYNFAVINRFGYEKDENIHREISRITTELSTDCKNKDNLNCQLKYLNYILHSRRGTTVVAVPTHTIQHPHPKPVNVPVHTPHQVLPVIAEHTKKVIDRFVVNGKEEIQVHSSGLTVFHSKEDLVIGSDGSIKAHDGRVVVKPITHTVTPKHEVQHIHGLIPETKHEKQLMIHSDGQIVDRNSGKTIIYSNGHVVVPSGHNIIVEHDGHTFIPAAKGSSVHKGSEKITQHYAHPSQHIIIHPDASISIFPKHDLILPIKPGQDGHGIQHPTIHIERHTQEPIKPLNPHERIVHHEHEKIEEHSSGAIIIHSKEHLVVHRDGSVVSPSGRTIVKSHSGHPIIHSVTDLNKHIIHPGGSVIVKPGQTVIVDHNNNIIVHPQKQVVVTHHDGKKIVAIVSHDHKNISIHPNGVIVVHHIDHSGQIHRSITSYTPIVPIMAVGQTRYIIGRDGSVYEVTRISQKQLRAQSAGEYMVVELHSYYD